MKRTFEIEWEGYDGYVDEQNLWQAFIEWDDKKGRVLHNLKVTELPEPEFHTYSLCASIHKNCPLRGKPNGACSEDPIYHPECFKPEQEGEFCECKNPQTFFDGGLGHKCIDCFKPPKPKKKLEKLDYSIFNKVDITVSEEGLRKWIIDKINEIIKRINEL